MKILELVTTIMLLGASNTFEAAPGEGPVWGDRLAVQFPQHEVVNWGVPGATAWHWVSWVVYFDMHFEGLVIVELGTNDSRIGTYPGNPELHPATPDEYDAQMRFLVGELLGRGADRVLLMTPPPNSLPPEDPSHVLMERYAERIWGICADVHEVRCGPDLLHLLNPKTAMIWDHIHYTDLANRRVAWFVKRYLRSWVHE